MNRKTKIFKSAFLAFLLFLPSLFWAQVISPESGTWANRQLLIVDVPQDGNVFYSLNGSDPETSGFAYDGPVLIDLAGEVSVNVSIIDKVGNRISRKISYIVNEMEPSKDAASSEFIKKINSQGIIEYLPGETFIIPSSLEYAFGEKADIFTGGCELSLSDEMVVSRFLPCVVTDGKGKWRFIVKISPVKSGIFSRKDVPFEIIDWNTLVFNDKSFIYKIDDQWWSQPKERVALDRTVNHMISWQSVDYSKQNVVKFYNLPPKPELNKEVSENGSIKFTLDSQHPYKIGLIQNNNESSELYDSIEIDTFKGDNFDGKVSLGIFYDSVCQSKLDIPFSIHRKNPRAPMILPSEEGGFARQAVRVAIASTEKNSVYYAISGPVILDEDYTVTADEILFDLNSVSYQKDKNVAVILEPKNEGAAAYKVSAYCVDDHGNKSKTSEYAVIIDQRNFFLDGTITDPEMIKKANGTIKYPFTEFAQILPLINKSRFVHVRVNGEVKVPEGTSKITSNCKIDGTNDARLILSPSSNFTIKNSSVSFSNCIITLAESRNTRETSFLFNLERAVLYFEGVELSSVFGKSGTIINSDNSVVDIVNSGLTASAESYSSIISSVKSKLKIKKSRLTVVAGTAVNISAQGGLVEISNSTCIVTGVMGRIAELFDTHSTITGNNFIGDLKKPMGNNKPVYEDKKNYSVAFSDNNITGF
ncbi:MAG: chitobiase/beta-hexosaminidase C-terminal domain-containing protein [Treponema sp.]|nr:chitobiase/beta-hexosaminidase C-terminal domain-containing protein [Treponema sp.]